MGGTLLGAFIVSLVWRFSLEEGNKYRGEE